MNYSENPAMCEVNFFKPSGKWYCTKIMDMTEYYSELNYAPQFKEFLQKKLGDRLSGMVAVCIHPYNKHEYPIMCNL